MKKLFSCLCASVLAVGCLGFATGCDDAKEEAKVMNVSLNPKVEFILDKDNKVLSVNALNDEGNLIINGQVFVGKTDAEAVKLYIDICKETGFLINGNISQGDNNIEISFSGDDAQKYYDAIKTEVNSHLKDINITATLEKGENLTKEYLNNILEDCLQYTETTKIEAMSYQEKLDALVKSRQETADLFSQELKDLYYQAKANAINQEKIAKAKEQVSGLTSIALSTAETVYKQACTALETARYEAFVKENSPYQIALQGFTNAKTQYLNQKNKIAGLTQEEVTTAMTNKLTNLESALTQAEEFLAQAKTTAESAIATAQTALNTAYTPILTALESTSINLGNILDNCVTEVNTTITNCQNKFKQDYQTSLDNAKDLWNDMKQDLKDRGQE